LLSLSLPSVGWRLTSDVFHDASYFLCTFQLRARSTLVSLSLLSRRLDHLIMLSLSSRLWRVQRPCQSVGISGVLRIHARVECRAGRIHQRPVTTIVFIGYASLIAGTA